ncbi:uncharacterized protein RSE6_12087 [Rhynchosporium secalis]|uniref:Uncharacterized protein n=1 Tax=Rhynchosporium secalis TaxID=38038 RepID=A0A1E1MQH5_RHYSE|nr:uncharacterized protein RSE6_12087 [Rhynchosporium secalis]
MTLCTSSEVWKGKIRMDCDMKKEEDWREMAITDVVGEEGDDAVDRRYENETPRNISALHVRERRR